MEQKKLKILIVDDDEMMRSVYADVFQKNNFEVIEAKDGLEGLEKAAENIPDIIFTGIVMPKMGGFDLIESLKKDTETARIPVVISSHMGIAEDKKRAMNLGAKDFFIKNFDTPNEVLARVESIFEKNSYQLKIMTDELDAKKVAKSIFGSVDFKCKKCGEGKIIKIGMTNLAAGEFKGKFICPECEQLRKIYF
jgi:DNA-binding response OmpR family regulator